MDDARDETDETIGEIADEQLPDDLRPGEDNPLAAGLEEGETVDDLLEGGKDAEQMEHDENDENDETDETDETDESEDLDRG